MNQVLELHPIPFQVWTYLVPLIVLSIAAVFNLFCSPFIQRGRKLIWVITTVTLISMMGFSFSNIFRDESSFFYEMLHYDRLSSFSSGMILAMGFLSFLTMWGNDQKDSILQEVHALLLFSLAGMLLLVSSTHLILLFIALEIMSLAIYIMVAMKRSSRFASEASLKYFIMGGVASAFFLYGAALIFGNLGTFDLSQMNALMTLKTPQELVLVALGTLMILGATLFKVGAFPFHAWVPDVYQGAISPVTGFMAAAIKFSAFILFIRLGQNLFFVQSFPFQNLIVPVLSVVAIATMFFGNIVALRQLDLKRMLSYSAIAHSGYLFIGLLAGRHFSEGYQAMIAYLVFYALSTLGTFAIISKMKASGEKDLPIRRLQGLGKREPFLAITLSLFLLSFAGIPLTAGFIGKYLLFVAAMGKLPILMLVLTIIAALISLAYYIKLIAFMFMKEQGPEQCSLYPGLKGSLIVIGFCAGLTFLLGLFPEKLLELGRYVFTLS